jgi:hypothetical protein
MNSTPYTTEEGTSKSLPHFQFQEASARTASAHLKVFGAGNTERIKGKQTRQGCGLSMRRQRTDLVAPNMKEKPKMALDNDK